MYDISSCTARGTEINKSAWTANNFSAKLTHAGVTIWCWSKATTKPIVSPTVWTILWCGKMLFTLKLQPASVSHVLSSKWVSVFWAKAGHPYDCWCCACLFCLAHTWKCEAVDLCGSYGNDCLSVHFNFRFLEFDNLAWTVLLLNKVDQIGLRN